MKEVMKNLDQAFGLLSQMVVNGDNVDLLASARMALRMAYGQLETFVKELEEKEREAKEVDKSGDNDRQTAEDAE